MISAEHCHYTTKFNSERHKFTKIFSIHSSKILFFPYSLYHWAFGECSSLPSQIKSDIKKRFGKKVFEYDSNRFQAQKAQKHAEEYAEKPSLSYPKNAIFAASIDTFT